MNNEPKISVAVCTYRRFGLLRDCLERIKNQTLPSGQYEILVIDNSLQPEESKAFMASLEGFVNLIYIITEKCGIAYARNVALEYCKASIILFTDDDVRVPPTWCEDFLKVFENYPGAGVIGGRVDPLWPSTPPSWLAGSLLNPLAVLSWDVAEVTPVADNQWLVTANAGYRVKALKKGGGFCERLGRKGKLPFWHAELGANMAIKSLGYDMLYAPHIQVGHMIEPPRMKKEWFFRQQLFGGASMVAVLWQKEEAIDFESLAKALEASYTELLKKELADDTTEDVVRVTNVFHDKGYKICLEHLGLDSKTKQFPPPRSTSWPVVYIVTPCMNAVSTIDQTILSVLSQAGDFCIRYHIQDGGSIDGTLQKFEEWKQRLEEGSFPIFCRNVVFTYTSEPDKGMYDAVYKGFESLSLPPQAFMTWINADDILFLGAMSYIKILQQMPDISWVGGMETVMLDNRIIWQGDRWLSSEVVKKGLCDGIHWDFVQQEGVFFRKRLWDMYKNCSNFRNFRLAGDWNLWRQFANVADFYKCMFPLGAFRKHDGQLSEQMNSYRNEIDSVVPIANRLEKLKSLPKKISRKLLMSQFPKGDIKIVDNPSETIVPFYQKKVLGDKASIRQATTLEKLAENDVKKNQLTEQRFTQLQAQYDEVLRQRDALVRDRDAVTARLDAIVAELAANKSFRKDMTNSLSWRVTAPLRYIAKFYMERSQPK